jgi:phosphoenolpyruvate phosphomutase
MLKSTILRRAVAGHAPVLAIGCHDGLGARLAQEAGFDAVWASGLEVSTSAALPDANILTMTQFLAAAEEMNDACDIPVICDCDTGFGNSNNVIHMVRRYEAAGLAAVCIEDKKFPKVNSFVPGRQELASVAEFVGKIMAAKSAQQTDDFMVIARVEALIAGWGEDEAMRRAEAYARAGADLVLIHSKAPTPEPIVSFLERWDKRHPIVVVPTTYPQLDADQLKELGANIVIYANHGIRTQIGAVKDTFDTIAKDRSTLGVEGRLVSLRRVFQLQGMLAMKELEKDFLRTRDKNVRVVLPAGGDLQPDPGLLEVLGDRGGRALLDLYGKPLLQRSIEAFALAGASDTTVVTDLDVSGVDANFSVVPAAGGLLGSIRAGLATLPRDDSFTVVAYSDLLLSVPAIENLLTSDDPMGVLVDRSWREEDRAGKKSLDLVVTDTPPADGARRLAPAGKYKVVSIGKEISPAEASFEFVGVLSLSPDGRDLFESACDRFALEYSDRPFGQAASFDQASLTDLLQQLVNEGQSITAVEQHKGWMEIHDFADYRLAVEQLGQS